eukprot:1007181-Prymnesium_polylepis.1
MHASSLRKEAAICWMLRCNERRFELVKLDVRLPMQMIHSALAVARGRPCPMAMTSAVEKPSLRSSVSSATLRLSGTSEPVFDSCESA